MNEQVKKSEMSPDSKIYVAGGKGLVGSAVLRCLKAQGFKNVISSDIKDFDLTKKEQVDAFFAQNKPEYVFLAAAKVGGIVANDTYPADFIRVNLQIQTNVIDAAHVFGVKKLLFLGSSCIYPKLAPQPMKEEYLLTGPLETTNDAYAIAKIAGILMCDSYNRQYGTRFIAAMPTNLYGPGDNFDLQNSHVLPAMIRKFCEAKEKGFSKVELWGTGSPRRELLYVDDLADALVFMMQSFEARPRDVFCNIGTGIDNSILELAKLVVQEAEYKGEIVWNTDIPDGTPRKLLDVTRMQQMGWSAKISLKEGISRTYKYFLENKALG